MSSSTRFFFSPLCIRVVKGLRHKSDRQLSGLVVLSQVIRCEPSLTELYVRAGLEESSRTKCMLIVTTWWTQTIMMATIDRNRGKTRGEYGRSTGKLTQTERGAVRAIRSGVLPDDSRT